MADYTKRTRQGYKVEQIYLDSSSITTLLAVIKREDDYLWGYAYHLEDGTWGQGHYNFFTKAETIRDLKSSYPRAKLIDPKKLIRVETEDDTFGKFIDMKKALVRAYHVAKHRNEDVHICKFPVGGEIGVIQKFGNDILYISDHTYRLYADGRLKRV